MMAMFTACGGGGGGGAAPATDTSAPTVVAATPVNGASSVSRIADLTFRVSEPLNAVSVTGTNVRLTYKNNSGRDEVPASVSYDATTKTITVNPSQPLSPATTYTLTLSNIQDAAGNTMPSTAIAFKTYVNPFMKDVFYTAAGAVDHYAVYIYDVNGNRARSDGYTAAGPDTTWLTGDDVVGGYEEYSHDANGNRIRSVGYTAGVVNGYEVYSYATNGNQTRTDVYTAAGMDGIWFNGDDTVGKSYTYDYNANGNRARSIVYTAGVVGGYEAYSYAANGNLTRTDVYTAAGMDGIWFNGDDTVGKSYTYDYNIDVNQTRSVAYNSVGVVDNYYTYTYDANGNNTELHNYTGAGVDGIWFTGDDVEGGYGTFSYDANGNRMEYLGYSTVGGVVRYRATYDPAL